MSEGSEKVLGEVISSAAITLSPEALRELLNKNWMTHDAMWFYNCVKECGIEKTNKINRAAVKAMGLIEVQRIKKALNIQKVDNFEDLRRFANGAFSLVKADFMKFSWSFLPGNILHGEMEPDKCWAYKGIKGLGVIDQYQCGIFDRIDAWFEGLGLKFEASPQFEGCLMHQNGRCYRDYKIFFKTA
jgi:hypothetical protein